MTRKCHTSSTFGMACSCLASDHCRPGLGLSQGYSMMEGIYTLPVFVWALGEGALGGRGAAGLGLFGPVFRFTFEALGFCALPG